MPSSSLSRGVACDALDSSPIFTFRQRSSSRLPLVEALSPFRDSRSRQKAFPRLEHRDEFGYKEVANPHNQSADFDSRLETRDEFFSSSNDPALKKNGETAFETRLVRPPPV